MAWIESHQELRQHPKTHALMESMGWNLYETIGRLHVFWYWCLDYAPDGDLRKFNDAVLAGSVGLAPKDGARFVSAMVSSCWIDRDGETFRVHDWPDYAGKYLQGSKFKRAPGRWAEVLKLYGRERPKTVCRLSRIPDLTKPSPPAGAGARGGDGGGNGRVGTAGDDPLDQRIRAYFDAHQKISWDHVTHQKFRGLIEHVGSFEAAARATEEAVNLGKSLPVGWALSKARREQKQGEKRAAVEAAEPLKRTVKP